MGIVRQPIANQRNNQHFTLGWQPQFHHRIPVHRHARARGWRLCDHLQLQRQRFRGHHQYRDSHAQLVTSSTESDLCVGQHDKRQAALRIGAQQRRTSISQQSGLLHGFRLGGQHRQFRRHVRNWPGGAVSAALNMYGWHGPHDGRQRTGRRLLGHRQEHALCLQSDEHLDSVLHALYLPSSAHAVLYGSNRCPSDGPSGNRSISRSLVQVLWGKKVSHHSEKMRRRYRPRAERTEYPAALDPSIRDARIRNTCLQGQNAFQNETLTLEPTPLGKTVYPYTRLWHAARLFARWNQHRPLTSLAGESPVSDLASPPTEESEWWPPPSPPR